MSASVVLMNMLRISHGIALSFFDKIADYLNRENATRSNLSEPH